MAAGTPKTKGSGRRNRADEVLDAAVEVFHEKGYAAASIQDVADRVGVLKGSLYHYIDSKEDLLARIFDGSDRQAVAVIEQAEAMEIGATGRLREFARLWSLWYLVNVERSSLYYKEWKHLKGERLAGVVASRRQYEERLVKLIDEAKAEGTVDSGLDTRYACFFILAAINGLSVWYQRGGSDSAEYIAEVFADMTMGMLEGTEGRRRPPKRRKSQNGRPKAS